MAVFYTGTRPVTKGRSTVDNVNPYTGEAGVYSNWSIFNTSQILDGFPNNDHTPGTGRHPHGVQMSRRFTGLDTDAPLDAPGLGPELTWWYKFSTLMQLHGADGQAIFGATYGHDGDRVTSYSLRSPYDYSGVTTVPFNNPGHVYRNVDGTGTANSFGAFAPYIYKGITVRPLHDAGQEIPDGYDNVGGHNKINEWRGVTSAKALNV